MLLTIDEFIAIFPGRSMSRDEFARTAEAKFSVRLSLYDLLYSPNAIIKSDTDLRIIQREWIIDTLYDLLITNRVAYLTSFFDAYFTPNETKMSTDLEISAHNCDGRPYISMQKADKTKNYFRNLFFHELLDYTLVTNTTRPERTFIKTFKELFNDLIIPDRILAPSTLGIMMRLGAKQLFGQMQQYLPKASILNPFGIKYILNIVPTGGKLCSMVLSWGVYKYVYNYLPQYDDYVGVDVMPSVCAKVSSIPCTKASSIVCCCSEKLHTHDIDGVPFTTKYANYFNVIIVCPPYFDMEKYHEGDQSIRLYPTYTEWLTKYWGGTLANIERVLKPGGYLFLIINNYTNLCKQYIPLISDFDRLTCEKLKFIIAFDLKGRQAKCRTTDKTSEQLRIYIK